MKNGRDSFEQLNLNALMTAHDYNNPDIMVGIERDKFNEIVVMVYDVSEMIEKPVDIENFYEIVEENALDIEDFKIDLFTIINA